MLGIRDILVRIRIRIPGSVPLTNGSGSGSGSDPAPDPAPDPTPFFNDFKDAKKNFLLTCPQAHHIQSKKLNFLLKFCVKILFCRHYFSPLNTFMRKREGSGSGSAHLSKSSGSPTVHFVLQRLVYNGSKKNWLELRFSKRDHVPDSEHQSKNFDFLII
jgi:hypothetical protein